MLGYKLNCNCKTNALRVWKLGKISLAILDLDMTLINTLHRFYIVYNEVRKLYGLKKIEYEEFLECFRKDKLTEILEPLSQKERISFWKKFRRIYSHYRSIHDKPYEGAKEALMYLRRKNIKAVVTTGREIEPKYIWNELNSYGLSAYVNEVYTLIQQDPSDEDLLFSRKGILTLILEEYKVNPRDAIFIADYWVDMEAGRKVGVITIGVLTGLKDKLTLMEHGAQYVIAGIWELPSLLNKLLNDDSE